MVRVFSGVQPTAEAPHLGNYIGAFRHWVTLQDQHESFICIVDLHSMTVPFEPGELPARTHALAAMLLACGIDERTVLFVQSHVPEHTELAWYLTCIARIGELNRMTQFKDKSRKTGAGTVGAGLLMYPVLMAADVLAYRADLVPVGDDQRQHLELMRDLAARFNRDFGETFPIPEALIFEEGARIMSLDDPTEKMSKSSDRPTGNVWMLDPPDVLRDKIGRAVTDSGREVTKAPDKPAISNLLDMFAAVTGREGADIESGFRGKGYAEFKMALADAVIAFLQPLQKRYADFAADPAEIQRVLERGAGVATEQAALTLGMVRSRLGITP